MKKSLLKCFAISLGLVLSLQVGSFAAKNIKASNYQPKTQLVGLSNKTKLKKMKKYAKSAIMNVLSTNGSSEIADYAGYYELDTSRPSHIINEFRTLDNVDDINGEIENISFSIEKDGKITLCASINAHDDDMFANITFTETEQIIKNAEGEFEVAESSNVAHIKLTIFVQGYGVFVHEQDSQIDSLSENSGHDKLHFVDIDSAKYLVLQSEDGVSYFKKVL